MNVISKLPLWLILFFFFTACTKPVATEPNSSEALVNKCPAIHDVSIRPFGELEFSGKSEKVEASGFNDIYLHDRDNKVKVGVRENWGAAIVFFGEDSNTLDDSKLDRGVQTTFHDETRAFQGCAVRESCKAKDPGTICSPHEKFVGWNPTQGGNICGQTSGVEGITVGSSLVATVLPLEYNPLWQSKECPEPQSICEDSARNHLKSSLRISQSLHFIKSHVLEVEVLVTNLGDTSVTQNAHEFPTLFANSALNKIKNTVPDTEAEETRTPATNETSMSYWRAKGGWASFQNASEDFGVGLYWENRNEKLRTNQSADKINNLRSNFAFKLPAHESVRGRYYLLLGGANQIKALAEDLDGKLPPFGRIDNQRIEDDTRTVKLEGWALDNKEVTNLELWVNGKKISDIPLSLRRDDVCSEHPGYAMCTNPHSRIGFETKYARPEGTGCEVPVEVRARDNDGNWRVIARKSISPVQYN